MKRNIGNTVPQGYFKKKKGTGKKKTTGMKKFFGNKKLYSEMMK